MSMELCHGGGPDDPDKLASVRAQRDALATELAEAHTEIQDLQRALSFWHPGVRANGTAAFVERAAHDAWLLAGYEGENESGAAELGWIEVTVLETACEHDLKKVHTLVVEEGAREWKATCRVCQQYGAIRSLKRLQSLTTGISSLAICQRNQCLRLTGRESREAR